MNQIAEATRPSRGSSGSGTGKSARSISIRAGSQFQHSVASLPRNPFTDSHAISTLTNVSVNDLDRVHMSTYRAETSDGRLWISFTAPSSMLTSHHAGVAVVLDLVAQDQSVQHVVATFPTEALSSDRTDIEGEISTMSNRFLASADFASSFSIDSSRRFY